MSLESLILMRFVAVPKIQVRGGPLAFLDQYGSCHVIACLARIMIIEAVFLLDIRKVQILLFVGFRKVPQFFFVSLRADADRLSWTALKESFKLLLSLFNHHLILGVKVALACL